MFKAKVFFISKLTFALLCTTFILFIMCSKKSSVAHENSKPVIKSIKATPSHIGYSDFSDLVVNATDKDKDALTYSWQCSSGSFVGSFTSDSVRWKSPDQSGTFRSYVTVSDGIDSTTSNVDVQVMGLFFDDFSKDLTGWTKSFCDGWISEEEAHVKGNRTGYYGTMYSSFNSSFKLERGNKVQKNYSLLYPQPEYTVKMKLARVDYFSSTHYFGLYTKVNDTGSISIAYWWFLIYPSSTQINWAVVCFVYNSSGGSTWALLAEDSKGYSSLINTGANEWNDVSWNIDEDKTLTIYVNNQFLYQSDEISSLETTFGLSINMDLVWVGARTYGEEFKMDDVIVAQPDGIIALANKKSKSQKNNISSFSNYIDNLTNTKGELKLKAAREILEKM